MASTEVIREYLTKIGYVTDAISQKKAEDGMVGFGKKVFGVGAAVAGLVASVAAATGAFAYSMRKMYYQSELSDSTVKNMNAMSYAAEQIGISGDAMSGAIHGMAQAMRLNPGLQALVESFGVKVTGRDMSDVAMDYVKALSKMPEFTGAKYAQMFGIDPDTFHQMVAHMGELGKKKQEMKGMYKEVGFDPDASKKAIMALASEMDRLEARASLVGQKLLASLVGPLQSAMGMMETGFNRFAKIIGGFSAGHGWATWLETQEESFANPFGKSAEQLAAEKKAEPAKAIKREQDKTAAIDSAWKQSGVNIPASNLFTSPPGSKVPKTPESPPAIPNQLTGENTRLGTASNTTSISQTNNITVHGAANPQETGKATAHEITRTFGNITRMGRGATLP